MFLHSQPEGSISHYRNVFPRVICLFFGILLLQNISISQGIGLNNTSPDATSILDITATNKGVLFPRMTTGQRNGITMPATGLIIYNTDCNEFQYFSNSHWISIINSNSLVSPKAIAASNLSASHFSANWESVNGVTAYYLDVSTNSSFTNLVTGYNNLNVGNVVTYEVSGLTTCTPYYYRVRAANACSSSGSSNIITASTTGIALLAGSWTNSSSSNYSFTVGDGSNRLLVLIAGMEDDPANTDLTAVTYGGVAMTQGPQISIESQGQDSRIEMWYLNEAGIESAATTNFAFTYNNPPNSQMFTAAAFEGVNQTTPIGNTGTNASTSMNPLPISPGAPLSVTACDMVVTGIVGGLAGTFVSSPGYTEGTDFINQTATTQTSYKSITTAGNENPATFNNNLNRHCTLGFQINH